MFQLFWESKLCISVVRTVCLPVFGSMIGEWAVERQNGWTGCAASALGGRRGLLHLHGGWGRADFAHVSLGEHIKRAW